jgi:subtilisin family serine protease
MASMRAEEIDMQDEYYWANDQKIPLVRDREVIALKFRAGITSRMALDPEAQELLSERVEPVFFIEHRGIKVYRTEVQERAVAVLGRQGAIEFATPAYRRNPGSEELMVLTAQFMVKFKPEISEAQIAEINVNRGARIVERLSYAQNAFTLESEQPGRNAIVLANLYREQEPTEWAHPVFVRRQARKESLTQASPATSRARRGPARADTLQAVGRVIPSDRRWHLGPTQARVTEAWTLDSLTPSAARGAREVVIAILDDGVDVDHPEFAGRVLAQFDFEGNVPDGRPKLAHDNHGTACAGVALAAGAGSASGAAPGCGLIVARTPAFLGVDEEARMFEWAARQGASVISCSWGPADSTGNLDPLPDNVAAAIEFCVTQGRGGKGIPIFWAAGNGDESVSLDGYAANPNVIAVAASTSRNTKSWYSDYGAEIWICAPSSGDDAAGEYSIFTTDRRGSAGYNQGDAELGDSTGNYTGDFGGTSSAAPLAAGIAALVLSANPDLYENPRSSRGRELRELLASTASKIGTGYTNGHSPQYGFGRIDAAAAVQAALDRRGAGPSKEQPAPIVTGPESWSRDAGPPTLNIDPGPGRYYAIELAADPSLLNAALRGADPNPNRFWASWVESPLSLSPTYPVEWVVPSQVWERLNVHARIYYRIWASDAGSSWTNALASTADEAYGSAPSLELVDGAVERDDPRPKISSPSMTSRDGAPPTFLVDPGPQRFYAVEVATQRELMDELGHAADRRSDNFFAAWEAEPLRSAPTYPAAYQLPADAWERLKYAPALYYRAWSSARASEWSDPRPSLDAGDFAQAPSVEIITGAAERRTPVLGRAVTPRLPIAAGSVSLTGPDTYFQLEDQPPAFYLEFTRPVTCRIQLSTQADSLRNAGASANGVVLSERLQPEPGHRSRMWRMPSETWRAMRANDQIYYRVVVERTASDTTGEQTEISALVLLKRSPKSLGRIARQMPTASRAATIDESRWHPHTDV